MGQYYMPLLRKAIGNKKYKDTAFDAHAFGNGLKLMEHSYVGNNFVNEIWYQLIGNPCRVYWVGDYTEPGDARLSKKTVAKFKRIWRGNKGYYTIPFGSPELPRDVQTEWPYLINHTKKEYVNVLNLGTMEQLYNYTLSPLPLLTATSNGRGSGDYPDEFPGIEDVGSWAGDVLETTGNEDMFRGYTEKKIVFRSYED